MQFVGVRLVLEKLSGGGGRPAQPPSLYSAKVCISVESLPSVLVIIASRKDTLVLDTSDVNLMVGGYWLRNLINSCSFSGALWQGSSM